MADCVGTPLVDRGGRFVEEPCANAATTTREGWRWRDRAKGEGLTVKVVHQLCGDCARDWDDRVAEGMAEAAAS